MMRFLEATADTQGDPFAEPAYSPWRQRITAAVVAAADSFKQLQSTARCQDFHDERTLATVELLERFVEDQQEATLVAAFTSMSEIIENLEPSWGDPCP